MSRQQRGERDDLSREIGRRESRKLRARGERRDEWIGLRMFGLVGWSVTVPTLLGLALGRWLDARLADDFSWTLALLVAGVVMGCANAWFWIEREGKVRRGGGGRDTDGSCGRQTGGGGAPDS